MNKHFKIYKMKSPYESPWNLRERACLLAWKLCWTFLCAWTPKACNPWRLCWLKIFGCKVEGRPFVHQRARIEIPWNLTLCDRACLGDGASAYSVGEIEIGARATVAQEAYLSAGTHDYTDLAFPLATARIAIGEDAFIGARAFVMPGISIGAGAVIGACSVVTKDVPGWIVAAGNPCRPVKPRTMKTA